MYFINFSKKEELQHVILIMYRKITMYEDVSKYDFKSLNNFHKQCMDLVPADPIKLRITPHDPNGWSSYIIAVRLNDNNYIVITISDSRSYTEVADRIMRIINGDE